MLDPTIYAMHLASLIAIVVTLCAHAAASKSSMEVQPAGLQAKHDALQRKYDALQSECDAQAQHMNMFKSPLAESNDADPGAAARCQSTLPGTPAGDLSCPTAQLGCFTKDGFQFDASVSMYSTFAANVTWTGCQANYGSQISCPDGIGPRGVLFTDGLFAGEAGAPTDTTMNLCATWSSIGNMKQRCTPDGLMCTKAQVLHAHKASRSSGTLVEKRTVCDAVGECSVFKAGRCIDVGTNIWSHTMNNHISDMIAESRAFGEAAENLLETVEAWWGTVSTACSSDWCAFAGVFNAVYSNGYTNTISITESGAVTASNPAATSQLVSSNDTDCPGTPCAKVEVYGAGKYDLVAMSDSGRLLLKHYNPSFLSGEGPREGQCSTSDEALSRLVVMAA